MVLGFSDWMIIIGFFIFSLLIGLYSAKSAGKSFADFFLSGRNMPWWLLGISMVATTFSCDTPNLVTDIVRQKGVSGNWAWWAFLLTGMLTVFVYAKLWRRSQVLTDLEFYELRYSGKMAAVLRGFRAIYLGVFFNVFVMAVVSLAMVKIGAVMLHWSATTTLLVALSVTAVYSTLGGLKGILLTDFFQFIISIIGAFGAAIILVRMPEVGGLNSLISHPSVKPALNMLPDFSNRDALITLFILPLAVQWWSVWYPGSEPGGGGYIAQRMLSAKNESGALKATFLFNALHYAVRPWPWIMVGLASLIVFPDLESMRIAFPHVDANIVQHDFAYPAMLSFLPAGFLGLVVASLIAAFMSTISTQVNWGASYVVNDVYRRFLNPEASDRRLVFVGRICTLGLMVLTALVALQLSNALQGFEILLQIGAGTGLIFILRWFWWRINAHSELTAMVVSFIVAVYFEFIHVQLFGFVMPDTSIKLLIGIGVTTICWLVVTLCSRPAKFDVLWKFYQLVQPGGPGWKSVIQKAEDKGLVTDNALAPDWDVPNGILCMVLGSLSIYTALFAFGNWIYGEYYEAILLTVIFVVSTRVLTIKWKSLKLK